jgi:hypothetical protein
MLIRLEGISDTNCREQETVAADNRQMISAQPEESAAVDAYVERGVSMATDNGCAAWTFELSWWGLCGQGTNEAAALLDLSLQTGRRLRVTERVEGDESAFARDREPCTDAERRVTLEILDRARRTTIDLVTNCPDEVLDWYDPERMLPSFASWHTLRQMAWHVVDTESRYYLPSLGMTALSRGSDLIDELHRSAAHVSAAVTAMPPDHLVEQGGEVWTSVKLLRRLAWHERAEQAVMAQLAERARHDVSRA